ncbi:hypothetical protein [Sorangium sp. So ce887]|uniref:hypothetical protein n=1 Tax=Sorangium sp. So ce887 TaxID=3133324 RepID=UPI003F6276B2
MDPEADDAQLAAIEEGLRGRPYRILERAPAALRRAGRTHPLEDEDGPHGSRPTYWAMEIGRASQLIATLD